MHTTGNTPVQGVHHIYDCPILIHCMLAIPQQSQKIKDQEIKGMCPSMDAISTSINIQVCTFIQDIQTALCDDTHHQ